MRYLIFTLLLFVFLCTCDRAQTSETGTATPTAEAPPAPETQAPAKEKPTDLCTVVTEEFVRQAIPNASDFSYQTGNFIGLIGCTATANINGEAHRITLTFQENALTPEKFEKMLETLKTLGSDSPPVEIEGIGDRAYVQAGSMGGAMFLEGEDVWKVVVKDPKENNNTELSERLLRQLR
ncbi:hypothetical protein QWY85_13930 [Neolewinella lacunae]|uniref:DUF3558 domain-containing protein n=1 Tax=Neolewinella lacunae TaxID=1517758 RepID=A0A923PI12_9BACT|nr:hypothetical protein [Neolewinella lacunae]MBC6992975.1 hypothetical protein [Neolewinella lacunae]MDN3635764.1 hypothetical protein [Neolewinella lacunae]